MMATTAIMIPCCLCGVKIVPNDANQCASCLAQQFDLKKILHQTPNKQPLTMYQCRQCRRYKTQKSYAHYTPESPELLSLLLKNIPALTFLKPKPPIQRLKLTDAMWIWTEPHSMRFKLRLTILAEIATTATIEQRLPVEFHVAWQQCPDCNRQFTNRTWNALVQLRQRRDDYSSSSSNNNEQSGPTRRGGLALIEIAISRNEKARNDILRLQTTRHGFDFYFLTLPKAQAFASYLSKIAPLKIKTASTKLVSTDVKNNTAHVKYTVNCDMVPLCKHDVVIFDKKCGLTLGGRMGLVLKVAFDVTFVDVTTGDVLDLHPEKYWKWGGDKVYKVALSVRRLVRFVVLDVELRGGECYRKEASLVTDAQQESYHNKYTPTLADVTVVRECDLGANDDCYTCFTHLGHLLQAGDIVWGYDLTTCQLSEDHTGCLSHSFDMPDVILVKKAKPEKRKKGDKRSGGGAAGAGGDGPPPRAKSSTSKKRERRLRKEKKRQEQLEQTFARMGFVNDENDDNEEKEDNNGDYDDLAAAVVVDDEHDDEWEDELENNPQLRRQLDLAQEHYLATAGVEDDDDDEEKDSSES